MAEKSYLRATTGFLLADGRQIRYGDLVAADDPMFKGKGRGRLRAYFQPVTPEVVEQATRAPGEIRIMTPRKTAAKSKSTVQEEVQPQVPDQEVQPQVPDK